MSGLLSLTMILPLMPMTTMASDVITAEESTESQRTAKTEEQIETEKPQEIINVTFVDVPREEYYYKAVLWAVEEGITGGTSATTFSPNDSCTRGQVVTFLYRFINK